MDRTLNGLLNSRKFWIVVIDGLTTLVIYFAVKYLDPTYAEDVKMVLAFLNAVVAVWIATIAWEDVSNRNSVVVTRGDGDSNQRPPIQGSNQ